MINEVIAVINFLRKRPMMFLAAVISVFVLLIYHSFFLSVIFAAGVIVLLFVLNYKKPSGVLIFCGLWLLVSMLSAAYNLGEIDRVTKFAEMTASGRFVAVKSSQSNGERMTCEIEVLESNILNAGDKFLALYDGTDISLGQTFRANATFNYLGDESLARNFYAEGIYLQAELTDIVLTADNDFILGTVNSVRNGIKNDIFKYFDNNEASTVLALLTGDNSYLSDEFYSNVKSAGVAHVMVVSGMHLSIIVAFVLKVVNRFLYNRYLKGTIIFMTVLAMAAVCGFTMSIMRAGITYILYAIALYINRQPSGDNCLGTAVSVILLVNPFAIFSIAFLLSTLSTFGILCIALPTVEFLQKERIVTSKALISLISAVVITLSALIMTFPVSILTFGYISNMSLLTNLLISFAATVVICLCIAGFVLFPLKGVIFYLANLITKYINSVINLFGSHDFATTDLSPWSAIIAVFFILVILFIMTACGNRKFMLKLNGILNKKLKQGGERLKWQFTSKKR